MRVNAAVNRLLVTTLRQSLQDKFVTLATASWIMALP